MITADEVMPLLLEACPSFAEKWSLVAAENIDDTRPGGRLLYLDAGDFIRHLVDLRLTNRLDEFPAIFGIIERLVVEGDPYVRQLAVIGFLEGLHMMTVTAAGLDPERDFRPWVGAVSETWWDRVNRFWAGDGQALRESGPGTPNDRTVRPDEGHWPRA